MRICPSCNKKFSGNDFRCPTCSFCPEIRDEVPMFAPEMAFENDGFGVSDYETFVDMGKNYFWFKQRNRLISFLLKKYFQGAESFCEIGVSSGNVLVALKSVCPGLKYYGSEIYLEPLAKAKSKIPDCSFFQADLCAFPFEEEFSVVGAFDVLEHITDDQKAMDNIYRAVKPGGGAIITVPQHQFLWSPRDEKYFHKRRYSRAAFIELASRSGFRICRLTSFISFLLPMVLMSRIKMKIINKDFEKIIDKEHEISTIQNYILNAICSLEVSLGKFGLSYPAGGSLVAVLKK